MPESVRWAVETKGLAKRYGQVESLIDCNLQIPEGCVFGLLGPNGAGKTTLLRTLLGFLRPSAGRAWISGLDTATHSLRVRRQVSYLPGEPRLYRGMRGRDVIDLFSGLHAFGSRQHAEQVAERLELDTSRRVMFMSTGMRQKLAIAIVLGCRAPLVVLDEPTANLDPNVRAEVLQLVNETRQQGRTVILSSHIFSDIDATCERVVIMQKGRIVAEELLGDVARQHIVLGELPEPLTAAETAKLQSLDFVDYILAAGGPSPRHIELHLSGPANSWLPWLTALQLKDLQIETAGIAAIYRRYHRPSEHHLGSLPTAGAS